MSLINVFQPSLGDEEADAVRAVMKSNWIGRGPKTKEFEQAWAKHIDVDPGLVQSVSTCTEGLFASMLALNIETGDEVIMPSISFVGAANAVVACGAQPVFCDVDLHTLNPRLSDIEAVVTPLTRAIIVLHYGGVPCADIENIMRFCRKHDIYLIEDCACAPASTYRGFACGTLGHIGVWSFDAMKIISTGDGGMIFAYSKKLAERIRKLLFLGLDSSSGLSSKAKTRWWEFDVGEAGRNATMNDITSSIGLVQLSKLHKFITARDWLYARYVANLSHLPAILLPPALPMDTESSYYFFYISVKNGLRDQLAAYLKQNDIYTTFRYYPLHLIGYYFDQKDLPKAEHVADNNLCLPLHQAMTGEDVDKVCDCIEKFFAEHK